MRLVRTAALARRHGAPAKHNHVESYVPITPRLQARHILTPIRESLPILCRRRQKVIFPGGAGLDRIGERNRGKTKLLNNSDP